MIALRNQLEELTINGKIAPPVYWRLLQVTWNYMTEDDKLKEINEALELVD